MFEWAMPAKPPQIHTSVCNFYTIISSCLYEVTGSACSGMVAIINDRPRFSSKLLIIRIKAQVSGMATKAPSPPRIYIQMTIERKTIVGETERPFPMTSGRTRFSTVLSSGDSHPQVTVTYRTILYA
jgi:hypothetical protein